MIRASAIAAFLGRPLVGDDVEVAGPKTLDDASAHALLFAKRRTDEIARRLDALTDVLVLAPPELAGALRCAHVVCDNPRLDFARVVQEFFAPRQAPRIASTAVIAADAEIGERVSIGEYSVVGAGAVIGDDTELRHHVVLSPRCVLGARCLVRSHAVIGGEGFGFDFDDEGRPVRLPHLGRVVVGDDVEIGALTSIARGTIGDTVVGDRVKIDDHVFIAHNVRIDADALVIAGAEVSGSVHIGRGAWIGPQVCILNGIRVGERAMAGLGAVIVKHVEDNVIVAGNPAKVLRARFPDEG